MSVISNTSPKVQFLADCTFEHIACWCKKTPTERFSGGRPGYDKTDLFYWLLVKRVTNWDYRTVARMAHVSHPTLIRANTFFLEHNIYHRFFVHMVKIAYKNGLIVGTHVAMDSSFVTTFSNKQEKGSGSFNGHKLSYGFKLHLLIDATTQFPIALIVGDGTTHDSKVAIPLLKRARSWLHKAGYVLADKGYDDTDIVTYIAKSLHAKAGIPMRKKSKQAQYKKNRYGNYKNWKLKAAGRTLKHSILNRRSSVERVFGYLKRVYHLGKEEVRGILAFTKQAYLALICYMLKKLWTEGITSF